MRAQALAAGVLALAVAGCGGSSPTLARLQVEATRVCSRTLVRSDRIRPPAVPSQSTAFLRRGIAALRPELAGLHTLRAPDDDARAFATALQSLGREITLLSATVHDLDRGADPLETIKTLQHRLAPVEAGDDAAWRTLGVPACVNR